MPALRLDAALIHLNRADPRGNGQYLGPDPYFDDLFCLAAEPALPVLRADRADRRTCWPRAPAEPAGQPGHGATAWSRRPAARTSPAACRTTAGTRRSRRDYAAPRPSPQAWHEFRAEYLSGDEAGYQEAVRRFRARDGQRPRA